MRIVLFLSPGSVKTPGRTHVTLVAIGTLIGFATGMEEVTPGAGAHSQTAVCAQPDEECRPC